MERTYKRIFVSKYECAFEWGKNSLRAFQSINEQDLFLVYQISEGKRPIESKRYIDKLGDKVKNRDVSVMSEEDRWRVVLEDLKLYQDKETHVFFLFDNEAFKYCADKGLAYAQIKSFMTLTQAVTSYFTFEKKKQDKEKRAQNSSAFEHKQSTKSVQAGEIDVKSQRTESDISKKVESSVSVEKKPHEPAINSSEQHKAPEKKVEHFKSDKQEKTIKGKDSHKDDRDETNAASEHSIGVSNYDQASMLGDIVSELSEAEMSVAKKNKDNRATEDNDEEEKTENTNDNGKKKNKGKGEKKDKKQDVVIAEETLEEIEKEIFGAEMESDEIVRKYTDYDNSRAKTVDLRYDKLIEGINKYLPKETVEKLTRNDYMVFVISIIKSYDSHDFEESWKTRNLFEIALNEREYNFLKAECIFFNKMCKVLFTEDKW